MWSKLLGDVTAVSFRVDDVTNDVTVDHVDSAARQTCLNAVPWRNFRRTTVVTFRRMALHGIHSYDTTGCGKKYPLNFFGNISLTTESFQIKFFAGLIISNFDKVMPY